MQSWSVIYRGTYNETEGNTTILAIAEYKGQLYFGAGRDQPPAVNIYRRPLDVGGDGHWENFSPPWSPGTSGHSMAMCGFQDQLYVGTAHGEIFRTDGLTWANVTHGRLDPVMALKDFQGSLYIATQAATIVRIAADGSWQSACLPKFGDPTNNDISSLEVFSGYLYAGVGKDDINGIQIWRTSDGTNWEKFHEILPASMGVFPPPPGHIHAMRTYNRHLPYKRYLYVAPYHGSSLFRTDGSTNGHTHWQAVRDFDEGGDIFRMTDDGQLLYLARSYMWASSFGMPLIYSSRDGLQWSPVSGGPVAQSSTRAAWSLLGSGTNFYFGSRKLYVGTKKF